MARWCIATGVVLILAVLPVTSRAQVGKSAAEIFDGRIMPIFRSPNPSSCVQCHLSSVDLKQYILPTCEQTFASLRDQGMIDLEKPHSSKILNLIDMGSRDADEYSKRIHEEMRNAEFEAFAEWIVASCKDEKLLKLPPSAEAGRAAPDVPDEVIRHARKSRVVDSFVRHVWSQRMRCFPCHTPHEIGPRQKGARKKFDEWYDQYGDQMLIFRETPEETLRYLVEESEKATPDYLPLLNLEEPAKSLLVLKPMSKIPPLEGDRRKPTYSEPVYHMGGLKIHKDDHSYKAFVNWIEDYARVTQARYQTVDDLPADNWLPTQRILRLKNAPQSWETGATAQMFVHGKNAAGDGWMNEPLAFTQGTITPRRILNGALILLGPGEPPAAKAWKEDRANQADPPNRLPPGDYLVRIYLDGENRLSGQPSALLPEADFVGAIELGNAKWRVGFPKAEWISGENLVR